MAIKSLERVFEVYPKIRNKVRGLPDLGKKSNGEDFSHEVKKIYNMFSLYGNDLYSIVNTKLENIESRSLGGGSPMKTPIFGPSKNKMMEVLTSDNMYEYPLAAGDEDSRKEVLEYLKKEGFKNTQELTIDNIIFTISSTHAFNMLMKVIGRPYDVILMTGPNYGLFAFVPERINNISVEILPLSEDDNWYVNPDKLSKKIDEINEKLKDEYGSKLNYVPKVVAFLNENPHNPLGKVMNSKNIDLLERIGNICLEKGVFVIDDIIYRDLTYDRSDLAIPMQTFEKFFDNTITITGLSKAYGQASLRSGMVVANESIIRGIRNIIFQTMDSSPIIQAKAISGAFNASKERYEEYEKYFNPIIEEYVYRLEILKALVNGIDVVADSKLKNKILKDIEENLDKEFNLDDVLKGIPDVDFVTNSLPDSGFFELLDFTKLKFKEAEGRIITNEVELLKYLYEQEKIKVILGQSISWPNHNQMIARVTTALEKNKLINDMAAMNRCIRKLR